MSDNKYGALERPMSEKKQADVERHKAKVSVLLMYEMVSE